MRVFTFLLMMTVAVAGGLGGYRLVTGRDLISLSDLMPSTRPTPEATISPPTATPTLSPAPSPTPGRPTATATPVPDTPQTLEVGNTGGEGVFLRRTPRADDRVRAWVDGTRMEVIGASVESEGRKWRKVRAPDGAEGYIPEEYLVEAR